jgi:hypothetical protein
MGRVRSNIVIGDQSFWALFDTGAKNSYVVEEVAGRLPTFPLEPAEGVALGGRAHRVDRLCLLFCEVEGLPVHLHARVLPEIGTDDEGKRIEVLFGALAMQEWGIVPIPHEEWLDMTHYTNTVRRVLRREMRRAGPAEG